MTTPAILRDEWLEEHAANAESLMAADPHSVTHRYSAANIASAFRELLYRRSVMSGPLQLVVQERQRQIEQEGWSREHDDNAHQDCELAAAAACYALCDGDTYLRLAFLPRGHNGRGTAQIWPQWVFKDGGYKRNLIKSMALLVAEYERIERQEAKAKADG